jgi:hypothetical protein
LACTGSDVVQTESYFQNRHLGKLFLTNRVEFALRTESFHRYIICQNTIYSIPVYHSKKSQYRTDIMILFWRSSSRFQAKTLSFFTNPPFVLRGDSQTCEHRPSKKGSQHSPYRQVIFFEVTLFCIFVIN